MHSVIVKCDLTHKMRVRIIITELVLCCFFALLLCNAECAAWIWVGLRWGDTPMHT